MKLPSIIRLNYSTLNLPQDFGPIVPDDKKDSLTSVITKYLKDNYKYSADRSVFFDRKKQEIIIYIEHWVLDE